MKRKQYFRKKNVISEFLSSKLNKAKKLHALKNEIDFNGLSYLVDTLSPSMPLIKKAVYGRAIVSRLEDLGTVENLYRPKGIVGEITWILLSVKKYARQLSLFVLLREEFEHYFLLGQYEKAEGTLGTILDETGYSLWYIEARFLLLEYQNKSEEQKEFLSYIHATNSNGVISTLSHFLSQRTERNLSAYKYDYDIENAFKVYKGTNQNVVEGLERYRYRLNFYESYKLEDYSYVLLFENSNSIVDRYTILLQTLRVMYVENDGYGADILKHIYYRTRDSSILPLIAANDPQIDIDTYFNEGYLKIYDLYYAGLYDEAIVECRQFVKLHSRNFDVLVIYAKCHVNSRQVFNPIGEDFNSLISLLSQRIYKLISNQGSRKDLLYNLYQINKNIISFDLSVGLDYFLKREQNRSVNKRLKLLSIFFFDPFFSEIYLDKKHAKDYLENGIRIFKSSISITNWQGLIGNELNEDKRVSREVAVLNRAKILFKTNRHQEAVQEWGKICEIFYDNPPIIQTAIKYWFDSLVLLEMYNDAIRLFVDRYLLDQNSVVKVASKMLVTKLRKMRYRGIKRTIDLPIFVSINSSDDLEKSFILEQYCKVFNKSVPSELFSEELDGNSSKVEFFYMSVCTSETLKHSIFINTTIDRLTERQRIINHLIEIYPGESKLFQDELDLVSTEMIIYQGTQKLEESKIYANDQAIINYELTDIDGLFKRYKTIYNLSLRERKILVITQKSFALYKIDDKEKYNETDVKYSDSALLEVFCELFDLILDKYLFSKFGIVAYLSTRIRHGVLLGEIRPEIEKQYLILSRIGNSKEYERSKYWEMKKFGLSRSQLDNLHILLQRFSLKIDTLIDDIIREKIQIKKDGKNCDGLFNYEFDKTELYSYAIELSSEQDPKIFCQKVIDIIWTRTDANLEVIRNYIDNEVKNQFSEEIAQLDHELSRDYDSHQFPEIFTNVLDCSTVIENKLKKVSSWFTRSGSSISDFDIRRLFDIIWANTKRCYPRIAANCEITIGANPVIKSKYYIDFTDLFRIFLDNMFKYGATVNGVKPFKFSSEIEGPFLKCTFVNRLDENSQDIPLESKDGELIINANKLTSENRSGISKAIKIVKYDFDNLNNYVVMDNVIPDIFKITVAIEIEKVI